MAVVLAPERGLLRALRGGSVAVASTVLALTAHVAGGGSAPSTGLGLVATVALGTAATAVADRRASVGGMFVVVGAGQLVLHGLLAALSPAAHSHATVPVVPGSAMLVAHSAAAVLTALLLARADAAVFAVARAVGLVLPRATTVLAAPPAPLRFLVPPRPVPVTVRVLLARVLPRRGPPHCS